MHTTHTHISNGAAALGLEQDIPDYDMDTSDEQWVTSQAERLDIDPLKFELMMDRLEKSSGQTVVTLNEAKALLKQDDEISIAVYDYWLNKRLKTQHPLLLSVRTENRAGTAPNNPYLAFRRRTEKMQTRKNRKNDETSYEKMLKLRRDLSRATTLLELIKRREKTKRELLHLSIEVFEKRYQVRDFNGALFNEFSSSAAAAKVSRYVVWNGLLLFRVLRRVPRVHFGRVCCAERDKRVVKTEATESNRSIDALSACSVRFAGPPLRRCTPISMQPRRWRLRPLLPPRAAPCPA